ncbi:hypothetical protein TNIN_300211 [Trichonephila inaurata madagascariensis]|uniref:Uncharacterized protein n=1 Tax=Trichonephila inaurata madagascariensis TaxID=2747483 RepID=A0A8X7BVU2_9ARAC|nr:hypothetical protein TNIN_300211 [Trichonephila inaurata madagascariensis]
MIPPKRKAEEEGGQPKTCVVDYRYMPLNARRITTTLTYFGFFLEAAIKRLISVSIVRRKLPEEELIVRKTFSMAIPLVIRYGNEGLIGHF